MRTLVSAIAVAAALLLAASNASAATEFGNGCVGSEGAESVSLISVANAPGSLLPATAPASGVITQWRLNVIEGIPVGVISQALKVVRPSGSGGYQVVGVSDLEAVVGGLNTFSTRIPIQAGDHLALSGAPETLFCQTGNTEDRVLAALLPGVGSPAVLGAEADSDQLPVVAKIEPDADGDGYGDETQDQCPQSAAYQGQCPQLTLDAEVYLDTKVIRVVVAANTPASVSVRTRLPWPMPCFRGKCPRRLTRPARGPRINLNLSAGPQAASPGELERFLLKLPKKTLRGLKRMSPRESLALRVEVSGLSQLGSSASVNLVLRLHGLGKR